MIGSRLPELMLIHDLDGELSAGVCSHCEDVIAEATPEPKLIKDAHSWNLRKRSSNMC